MRTILLKSPVFGWPLLFAIVGFGFSPAPARGAGVAVVHAGPAGPTLLKRDAADKQWDLTKDGEELAAGTHVMGGLGVSLTATNGSFRLTMTGDIAGKSPFPILETALVLGEAKNADFAVTFGRGRIDLVNTKKSGSATAQVTIHHKTIDVVLAEPNDRVVIEIYGRWAKGTKFTKKPTESDAPALAVLMLAVKGEADIKAPSRSIHLQAPPGPALVLVSDCADPQPQINKLDALPDWVDAKDSAVEAKAVAAAKKMLDVAGKKSLAEALQELVVSDEPAERRLAIVLMGATDNLKGLGAAVLASNHPDVWENGILILRNWIGRGHGQDQILYKALLDSGKYTESEAEIVLQLLHSFGDDDLARPATYQGLIDFLDSPKLCIRGLAYWHLVRLVPAGRDIPYSPTASDDDRAKAVKSWRDLVRPGTLPGSTKKKSKKDNE
jgi:hypothetical protein